MLTAGNILVSIFALFIFGLPVASLLFPREENREKMWIFAPLLGLTLITLFLQNLVYLDIPIQKSTPWLWALAIPLWVLFLWRRPFSFRPPMPIVFLYSIALGIYFVQGLGLLLAGAEAYVGRAWHDFFNYTAIAQFLADYPFSLSIPNVQDQPYLYRAIILKTDRIGPSIFQAFHAVSAFSSAKASFEPAILLSPFLIVFSIYGLARSFLLSPTRSLRVAAAAGLLPGIAMVHLESFFSQALGIPYLLIWPILIHEILAGPTWRNILGAALILAGVTTMYTEFYPLFGILILLGIFGRMIQIRDGKALPLLLISSILTIALAFLLNPGFFRGILTILERVAISDILSGIYPWAFKTEGLQRIWLGDLVSRLPGWLVHSFRPITFLLILMALTGLGKVAWKRRDSLSLALFGLAFAPICLRLLGPQYQYQFYKILLSICPLLPLGLTLLRSRGIGKKNTLAGMNALAFGILFLGSIGGSVDMAYRSGVGKTEEKIGRGGAHMLVTPAALKTQENLSNLKGQNILLIWQDDFFNGAYLNGWLAYYARNNRVWVTNPLLSDVDLRELPQAHWRFQSAINDGFFLVPPVFTKTVAGTSVQLAWSEKPFSLFRVHGKDWVAISGFHNPNGLERSGEEFFFWVGNQDATLEILSGRPGILTLQAKIFPGPSLPEQKDRHIMVTTQSGYQENIFIQAWDGFSISVPVIQGLDRIKIRVLDPPTISRLPSGDTRTMLLQIRDWRIVSFIVRER